MSPDERQGAELHGRREAGAVPGWMILLRDVLLIICWELLRSGSRKIEKETEAENEHQG